MRLLLDEARDVVETLAASIFVGVNDRCALRNAEHRERYVSSLRLACTKNPFSFGSHPFYSEASDRKRMSCFHGSAPLV
jgi:hypothetical protein